MKIFDINELKRLAHEARNALDEESAFDKLLKVLVDYGMNEEKAAQMIADCIDEQYELDRIRDQFSDNYLDAKDVIMNQGSEYKA